MQDTNFARTKCCNRCMDVVNCCTYKTAEVSGGLLQTAQTWGKAGVCIASCVHMLGSMGVVL